jgi:hypothetical protein
MPEFKLCKGCKKNLPLDLFTPHKRYKYGVLPKCRVCSNSSRKSRVGNVKVKDYSKNYYSNNKEKILLNPDNKERARVWVVENRDKHNERNRQWSKENKAYGREKSAKRRSTKVQATPVWLTDGQKAHIKRTYKLAALMEDITGVKYHVDHIIPLKGDNVCGLHIPENLQVLRAYLNMSKSNTYK